MKPITRVLPVLLIIFFTEFYASGQTVSAAVTTLSSCTTQIVTLTANWTTGLGHAVTNSYNVSTNQIVTLNYIGNNNGGSVVSVGFNYPNGNNTSYSSVSGSGLPITYTGLSGITLLNNGYANTLSATFTILTPSTNYLTYTPANSVVIPSDATGNVQIVLQSSSDLVNWIPSQPGTYGNTYSNRFFRVIALAQ
jgi:hypothetical protein